MSQYIHDVFTKPRWELSILDTAAGIGVIVGLLLATAVIFTLIAWLSGKFKKKKK